MQILIKQQHLIRSLIVKKATLKYFFSYKNAEKIRPLCIFLPKRSAYIRDFDETKYISFLIKDDEFLEKYKEIWKKVKNILKKEFYSKPVYNGKYLKAKIKRYCRFYAWETGNQ